MVENKAPFKAPLADRMRPRSLKDFLGQDDLIGKNKLLRKAIEKGKIPSMILWGPPGSGKTTLARIVAEKTGAHFQQMSAVASGLKELRKIIKLAQINKRLGEKTILFLDEIHRWNKAQQDALLPHIEKGEITLIGATTENPSFELNNALLSRCHVFVLKPLSPQDIKKIIKRALKDKKNGFGNLSIKITEQTINFLSQLSNGDARCALNALEYAVLTQSKRDQKIVKIKTQDIKEAFQKSHLMYDRAGEEHYNLISALHKSMRGSDANAALYWLARMLEGGEDPLYIARRLIRFACEDIGLANSRALEQAVAAYNACHYLGMPECNVVLAQAVVYMAKCKKSNALYEAYEKAAQDVREKGNLPVPLHLRNAPTALMKKLGYGKGYKYSPDYNYKEKQQYLPDELKGRLYLDQLG